MNRVQLVGEVMAYLHRLSFRSPVQDFDAVGAWIALAEEDLNKRVRTREMVTRVSQPVTGQYTTLPCDFLETHDVRLENGPELTYQPRSNMANIRWGQWVRAPGDPAWSGFSPPAVPWNGGQPQFYSVVGQEMELMPFPDDLTLLPTMPNLELTYYHRQELGQNDTDTTAVLTTHPSVYLWGALAQSGPFLRDDQRVATWSGFYEAAISGANSEAERARWQGTRLQQRYRRLA